MHDVLPSPLEEFCCQLEQERIFLKQACDFGKELIAALDHEEIHLILNEFEGEAATVDFDNIAYDLLTKEDCAELFPEMSKFGSPIYVQASPIVLHTIDGGL